MTSLEYKNVPISSELQSRGEIKFRRKVRDILPHKNDTTERFLETADTLQGDNCYRKNYFDRNATNYKPFSCHDKIFIYSETKSYKKATLLSLA